MKVRNGFVSNSSSSSFLVSLDDITARQRRQIEDHIEVSQSEWFKKRLREENDGEDPQYWFDAPEDAWSVYETEDGTKLRGYTSMNNFDMEHFMRVIGVDMSAVEFDY